MANLLPNTSIFVGGWFGGDGVSEPDDGVFTDGWYGGPESIQDISDRLARIEAALIANKPIFINIDGHFEELNILEFTP